MKKEKINIIETIKLCLSSINDKADIFIIGSFIEKDEYDDIDFIVVTSDHKKDIFYSFYVLSILLNKKIDVVVMDDNAYRKFIETGESINTHQVFVPPKKRKCMFLNNMINLKYFNINNNENKR